MECGILLPQRKPMTVFDHLEEKKAEDEDNENVSFRGSEVGLHVKNTKRGRTTTIQVSSWRVWYRNLRRYRWVLKNTLWHIKLSWSSLSLQLKVVLVFQMFRYLQQLLQDQDLQRILMKQERNEKQLRRLLWMEAPSRTSTSVHVTRGVVVVALFPFHFSAAANS